MLERSAMARQHLKIGGSVELLRSPVIAHDLPRKNCCPGDGVKNYTGAEMVNELLTPLQTGGKKTVEAGTLANRHGWQAAHQAGRGDKLRLPGKIIRNDG